LVVERTLKEKKMAKGYWVTFYRSVSDPAAFSAYAVLAGPVIEAGGGRFLARGLAIKTSAPPPQKPALDPRVVIIEFDSLKQAIATHESAGYQATLKALGNAVEREIRFVEGV